MNLDEYVEKVMNRKPIDTTYLCYDDLAYIYSVAYEKTGNDSYKHESAHYYHLTEASIGDL